MEAFGNCRTISNLNATRYVQIVKVQFDQMARLNSVQFQILNLERTRLSRRPDGEPTFHVFYQLLAGVDDQYRQELFLNHLHEPNVLMTSLQKTEDKKYARDTWKEIMKSMETLKFSEEEVNVVLRVLAALYHVGAAGVARGILKGYILHRYFASSSFSSSSGGAMKSILLVDPPGFHNPELGGRHVGASMFDLKCNYLQDRLWLLSCEALIHEKLQIYLQELNETYPTIDVESIRQPIISRLHAVDGKQHQHRTFHTQSSIRCFIIQYAGMRVRQDISLVDVLEIIRRMPHDNVIIDSNNNNVIVDCDNNIINNNINNTSNNVTNNDINNNNSNNNSDSNDFNKFYNIYSKKRVDSVDSGADDDNNRVNVTHASEELVSFLNYVHKRLKETSVHKVLPASTTLAAAAATRTSSFSSSSPLFLSSLPSMITINHSSDENIYSSVNYNVKELIKSSSSSSSSSQVGTKIQIRDCLLKSSNQAIRNMSFIKRVDVLKSSSSSSSPSSSSSLSSSSLASFITDVDGLMEELSKRQKKFVFCWLPNNNVTSTSEALSKGSPTQLDNPPNENVSGDIDNSDSSINEEHNINIKTLRDQWRATCLLDASKLYNMSFPQYFSYFAFANKFQVLAPNSELKQKLLYSRDYKNLTKLILSNQKIEQSNFKMGITKVFFRPGSLSSLEAAFDDVISGWIVDLQRWGRGMLTRKRTQLLQMRTDAMRCIQENMRQFMVLRRCPWWRVVNKLRHIIHANVPHNNQHHRDHDDAAADDNHQMAGPVQSGMKFNKQKYKESFHLLSNGIDVDDDDDVITSRIEMLTVNDDDDVNDRVYNHEAMMKRMQLKHKDELDDLEATALAAGRKLAYALEDMDEQKSTLTKLLRELEMKNNRIATLTEQLEEATQQNDELQDGQHRLEKEVLRKKEMLKYEESQHEEMLKELERMLDDRATIKQQLDATLTDLEREVNRRKDVELKLRLYCGANVEVEALKQQNTDLLKNQTKQQQKLEDQEATIKKLLKTIMNLEDTNTLTKQTLLRTERQKEQEMDDSKFAAWREKFNDEGQLNEIKMEKDALITQLNTRTQQLEQLLVQKIKKYKSNERGYKALLKKVKKILQGDQTNHQNEIDDQKVQSPHKLLKLLRSHLNEAEHECDTAKSMKIALEADALRAQQQIDALLEEKQQSHAKNKSLLAENSELSYQLAEQTDEYNNLMKKYSLLVKQELCLQTHIDADAT
ncbi:hypothetical protein HELRODRAFT_188525 [Helobdella robusta]|uniref:Myosin motor domain-containing protein n=1 Tax=Helobdella robusta TaxID=6412 RepID=T1FQ33_HELRO|nr:hypothetical protein HELRODRAFT_188525 [Helobdella robusta]ESO01921.1 hypothetical protein HELRODRAFT_188525 [Helobdella robusta]